MVKAEELSGTWSEILHILKDHISSYAYKNWFRESTVLLSVHEHQVELGVPNGTYKNVIKNKFGHKVQKCCEEYFNHHVRVVYTIYGKLAEHLNTRGYSEKNVSKTKQKAQTPSAHRPGKAGFHRSIKKVTINEIVVGGFNMIAVSAVKSVIKRDPDCPNPLFIYGGTGMGKTMLLQMAYHEISRSGTGNNVVFTSCEAFMNDYISSLRNGSIDTFRSHFRNTEVFLIDDIHFLGKGVKKSTKEEFYHTINTLLNAGQQVVVTCDKHPATVEKIGTDIVNLMMGGMWVQLAAPDKEMRIEILRKMSAGQDITDEAYEYIAKHFSRDIRELTGALTTALSFSKYAGEPCSIHTVKKALGSGVGQRKETGIGVKRITDEVCSYFGVEQSKIFSDSRRRKVVNARHVAIYLCNVFMKDASLGELGVIFNNSRPAVLYAGNKVTRALKENDRVIAPAVREIRNRLEVSM